MRVYSNIKPAPYWIRVINNGSVFVRLRKNIVETEKEVEDGETGVVFRYEEVEIQIPFVPNLSIFIEDNFDDLWLIDTFNKIRKVRDDEKKIEQLENIIDIMLNGGDD